MEEGLRIYVSNYTNTANLRSYFQNQAESCILHRAIIPADYTAFVESKSKSRQNKGDS